MAWISAGSFFMGSAEFYPEEAPVRPVEVDGFWIDEHPVTVAEFRRFEGDGSCQLGGAQAGAGRLPRRRPRDARARLARVPPHPGPVDAREFHNWWSYVPDAF